MTRRPAHRQPALVLQHEHRLHGERCRACWLAGQGAKPSTGLTTASEESTSTGTPHMVGWLVMSTNRHSRIPWWWMASPQNRWQSASMRLTDSGISRQSRNQPQQHRCSPTITPPSIHPIFCCAAPGGQHLRPVMHKHNTHPTTAAACSVPTQAERRDHKASTCIPAMACSACQDYAAAVTAQDCHCSTHTTHTHSCASQTQTLPRRPKCRPTTQHNHAAVPTHTQRS